MALVTYNRSIDSFHGSVGRMVFYKRNGQTLLRSKGNRSGRRSEAQIISQEAFRAASARWKEFSAAQKEPWRSHGRTQGMTGYNAFLKTNIPRLKNGDDMLLDAPVKAAHQRQSPDNGCVQFMQSIHEMIRRLSSSHDTIMPPWKKNIHSHGTSGAPLYTQVSPVIPESRAFLIDISFTAGTMAAAIKNGEAEAASVNGNAPSVKCPHGG